MTVGPARIKNDEALLSWWCEHVHGVYTLTQCAVEHIIAESPKTMLGTGVNIKLKNFLSHLAGVWQRLWCIRVLWAVRR